MEGGEVNLDHTTIRNIPPPPSPTGLTAQAGTGQATLRWDAYPVDADITEWQYSVKAGGRGVEGLADNAQQWDAHGRAYGDGPDWRRDLYVLGAGGQQYWSRFGDGGCVGGFDARSVLRGLSRPIRRP